MAYSATDDMAIVRSYTPEKFGQLYQLLTDIAPQEAVWRMMYDYYQIHFERKNTPMESYQIIGNVTGEPETRTVNIKDGQITVCNFNVAINSRRKGTTEQNDAKFIRVNAWRKLGEICQQYLHKGSKVYISGTIEAHAFTNKDGQPAASIDMTAQDVEFLSSKPTNQSEQTYNAPAVPDPSSFTHVEGDQLPF